jgi:hypothetical protein
VPLSFPGNAAIARQLGRLADITSPDGDRGLGDDDALKDAPAPPKPGLEALGLIGKPATERYRILFVFDATPPTAPTEPQK